MRLDTIEDVDAYFRDLPTYKKTSEGLKVSIWGNLVYFVERIKQLDTSDPLNLEHVLVRDSVTEGIDPKELAVLFSHTGSICLPRPLTDGQREAVVYGMFRSGHTLQKFTVANSDDNLASRLMDQVSTLQSVSEDFPGMLEYFGKHSACAIEENVTLSGSTTDDDMVVATEY